MTGLLDLPDENLIDIAVRQIPAGTRTPQRSKHLWVLSETCRRLNACCAHILFRSYILRLRVRFHSFRHHLTPLDSKETLVKWDLPAVRARLAHFRQKAPFVRELIIEDIVPTSDNGPFPFPDVILPDLIAILQQASRVTVVHINTGYKIGTLPIQIWSWLTTVDLTTLRIEGNLSPPENASSIAVVENFHAKLYQGPLSFLKLVRPKNLHLEYYQFHGAPKLHPFKPSGPEHSHIRKVNLELTLPKEFVAPLFDFSGIPEATIHAAFDLGVEYKMQVLGAWIRQKRILPTIFAEGLEGYSVVRTSDGSEVSRPPMSEIPEGWEPESAHLQGKMEESDEMERIRAHYALRTAQFLQRMDEM